MNSRYLAVNDFILEFFKYCFVICMIFSTRTMYLYISTLQWLDNVIMFLMGISVIGGIFAKRKFSYNKLQQCIVVMFALFLYFILFYFIDPYKKSSIIKNILKLLTIIPYCLLVENSVYDTLKKFGNVILIISIGSLFFWMFGSVLKIFGPSGVLYTSWTGNGKLAAINSYYNLYFEYQKNDFFGLLNENIWRNTAIFTEAPMASLMFSTAFSFFYLYDDAQEKIKCLILAFAVVSTTSSAGITVLLLSIGLRYLFKKNSNKYQKTLKIITIPLVFFVFTLAMLYVVDQKVSTNSGSTRVDDFVAGYKAWQDSPFFGNGFDNSVSIIKYMSSFRSNNTGFSNSLMQVLAYGGIYLFFPYLISIIVGTFSLMNSKQWLKLSFYIIFVYSFIITSISFQVFTYYLFISFFREGITMINYKN